MQLFILTSFKSRSFVAIGLFFLLVIHQVCASVLAIDYGTEWTKAALVKPGIPLQIVLTKDSKRKEQSVVAFKRQERLYGVDAFNLAARFPETTYPSLKSLLGRTVDADVVKRFLEDHPSIRLGESNRTSLAFVHGQNTYSVEELVAMQLFNIKLQAEKMAEEKIKELVLTVPVFWTEQERKAIVSAAELAGMRVSTLIQDGLAVAIQYGTSRTFSEEPQYHLIYDMGAGSTTATIVSFSTHNITEGRSNKTVIDIATHGIGFDRELGGDLFNVRIVDILIEAFHSSKAGAKAKTDIKFDGRALARLFREASRVKHVLSANADTVATVFPGKKFADKQIESLHENIDFRTKVTRATFEDATSDLIERATQPIQVALKNANLTLNQLESVILHGGNVRVPFVQKAIEDVVGADKVAKTVNADEAAVMGAIFRGAQLNTQFRVKDIKLKDFSTFPINIISNATLEDSNGVSNPLFPRGTKLGKTKVLAFKTSQDVSFTLKYASDADLPNDISQTILTANVYGVAEKIDKLRGADECHDPTVKVNLKLSDAGLIDVLHSEVQCELREKKNIADKLKGFFGGAKDKTEEEDDQIIFEAPSEESTGVLESSSSASSEAARPTPIDKSEKVRYERAAIKVSVVDHSPTYLTPEQKSESKKMLTGMNKLDRDRIAREEALNSLEAYIYRSRDFFEDEIFEKVSSADEQKLFKEKLEAASEWLYSSDSATLEDFKSKLSELMEIEGPISKRKEDFLARPQLIESLQQILNSTKELVRSSRDIHASKNAKVAKDEDDLDDDEDSIASNPSTLLFHFDEKSIETLDSVVGEVETWLTEKIAQQEQLKLWEEPVLLLKDLEKRSNQIQSVLRKVFMDQAKTKTTSKTSSTPSTAKSSSTTEIVSTERPSKPTDVPKSEDSVYGEDEDNVEETSGPVKHEEL